MKTLQQETTEKLCISLGLVAQGSYGKGEGNVVISSAGKPIWIFPTWYEAYYFALGFSSGRGYLLGIKGGHDEKA